MCLLYIYAQDLYQKCFENISFHFMTCPFIFLQWHLKSIIILTLIKFHDFLNFIIHDFFFFLVQSKKYLPNPWSQDFFLSSLLEALQFYFSHLGHWSTLILVSVLCVLSHVWLFATPWTCNPPGTSVHGVFQARILEWVIIFYSRRSSWPRDQTCVCCISCIGRQIVYHCTTWKALN